MGQSPRQLLAIAAAALLTVASGGALSYAAHAHGGQPTAATTYDITAGYGDDDFAANIFNPKVLTVYAGDTVRWHVGGKLEPHDIVFGPKAALDQLAASGTMVVPHKAGPPTIAINPRFAYPSGGPTYDGTGMANSGVLNPAGDGPQRVWSLTFTTPGAYRYFCLFHYDPASPATSMGGLVRVLPRPVAGHVYHITSGYDDGTRQNEALAFLPQDLTIHVGDTVVWSPGFHNVAFGPLARLAALRRSFIMPIPQKNGPPMLVYNPQVAFPVGGPAYDGTGFVNSGILVMPKPHPWALTFTKPGRYTYWCLIHTGMDGHITVLPAGQ